MKLYKTILFFVVLGLIAGTAFALNRFKAGQKLGRPGIKAEPIEGSVVMKIDLPETVLDFTSTNLPQAQLVLDYLPKDTSFAQRLYQAPDGFGVVANIILQGADRSSIHKADYCLNGQGWRTVEKSVVHIPIAGSPGYELPVARWNIARVVELPNGSKQEQRGLYVFWFVADGEQTSDYGQRLRWLIRDVLYTGVLQRWAYVSYQTSCAAGQEDAAFERMKPLIAASVPEFQLPPRPAQGPAVASQ